MISIRRAGPADAGRLALVGAATFLETFAGTLDGAGLVAHCGRQHSPQAYAAYLADPRAAAWLSELKGAPVGYALLAPPDLPIAAEDSDVELKRIYLLSRFQGGGTGKALMAAAVEEARMRRHRRLLLGVYAGNERALAFYRSQGFTDVGRRRFDVGGELYDDLILALAL